jgi:hypothetical protein
VPTLVHHEVSSDPARTSIKPTGGALPPFVHMAAKILGILDYVLSRLLGARVIDRERYAVLTAAEQSRQQQLENAIDLESVRAGRAEIAVQGAVDWQDLKAETV